ncbi:Histidine protein kinase DivJ [Terricaulis silvestris]|uniref:histidine kinase n=2 Tax=Terricaulis silvestris TaxID=2686094 RepID=A0A6I6MS33_9CAUL|nr:Histidine protein kinase DivJ [Terricaulis silvestris]
MSAIALRSLLLAGRLSVSTQHAANSPAIAAPRAVALGMACWFWLAGVVSAVLLAFANGAERAPTALAAALAIAPALTGFTLLLRFGRKWADAGWLAVWLTALTGLVAGTGGASSPLAAGLLIVPAMAIALGRPWAPEAGAAAVLGYALAALLSRFDARAELGPFAEIMTVVSIVFAAGVMALGRRAHTREAAMSQRIAEVSHELRTPLTHILGFSEMIERKIFGDISDRYVEYAGLIRKSGTHLLSLVNDLLDLSRIEAGRYELDLQTFDVRAVVEEVTRLSTDSAEKKQIALGMLTPETPLMVRADDRSVKRMLINTVGNAIKFTPEGGRVFVSAAMVDGALVLDTTDNGPGIPEEEREKLGQAYERGSGGARAEGTGLGLSLVRALAVLHGGALSFHDAPGGGALVRITLPVLAP